ncbi:MAG: PDZ domain-containing protein [Actinobacteria bacterium]|nr:PDZ domain-containing protein [Actinomycetota bacterium]
MTLFDENVSVVPAPPRRLRRSTVTGLWALSVALLVLLVLSFLPTAYVIQQPGPVIDTLGTSENADGEQVPLITVPDGQDTTGSGRLDLLTVQVVGNRERTPSWLELVGAWFNPSRAVVPLDRIFPAGETTEERNTQNVALMNDSQQEATAAALEELGYDVGQHVRVNQLNDDAAAAGSIEAGDTILSVDGVPADSATAVRDAVQAAAGAPVSIELERDGRDSTVEVTPALVEDGGESAYVLGIVLENAFDFPIDVEIQLNNVGGPSAGMMFALGIIDKLSPEDLTGGQHFAGTGTIDAEGNVGPIGGIRQKLYGARDAGATWFLAPEANCDEVVGHVPDGLRVFSTATLEQSLTVLETVRDGGDLDALPTCGAETAAGS